MTALRRSGAALRRSRGGAAGAGARSDAAAAADPADEGGAATLRAHVVVPRPHFAVDVRLEAAAGETVAIMGPSGAGKSTVLEALAGLVALRAGEIAVAGRIVDRVSAPRVRTAPMHRGVVLLGQDPRLFPHLSVRENVAFGLRAAGAPAAPARARADVWLERVGLPGSGDRVPGALSGGEQQRVAVARALAASPRAVLLDEPLVALDPVTAAEIRSMLRERLAETTTIAVTHDAGDAIALADRLLVVEAGRVTQSGAVREVLAAPASAFVAALAGVNRVVGVAEGGAWRRSGGGDARLESAQSASHAPAASDGAPLAAVFRPGDVRVVADDAAGTNTWPATVGRLEPTTTGVRVHTEWCAVDLAVAQAAGLLPGDRLRLRVEPGDVRFVAAP